MEILVDNLTMYAHIDSDNDEAVVAHHPEILQEELARVYRTLVSRGYQSIEGSWHDTDWGRDVLVLKPTPSP